VTREELDARIIAILREDARRHPDGTLRGGPYEGADLARLLLAALAVIDEAEFMLLIGLPIHERIGEFNTALDKET